MTIELTVTGMSCGGCAASLQKAGTEYAKNNGGVVTKDSFPARAQPGSSNGFV